MKLANLPFLFALAAMTFSACDTVDGDERFAGPISVEAKKNVLVEDFTGQRCVNCPNATEQIHAIQETYGASRVIAVAIHGGTFGVSEDKSAIGLATDEGEKFHKLWGASSYPIGLVDRQGGLSAYTDWQAKVVGRFNVTPKADLKLTEATVDPATKQISVRVLATPTESVKANLQVWVTEYGIVAAQSLPNGTTDRNYVHNHVYRGSMNADLAGLPISLDPNLGATDGYAFTLTAKDKWNTANLHVVAILSNETDGVIQVIETPLTPTTTE